MNDTSEEVGESTDNVAIVGVRTTVLTFLLLASFAGNSLLLATLVYSRTLRRRSSHRLLSNACVANLADLLCNCTVAMGASVAKGTSVLVQQRSLPWRQAPWSVTACQFSSFTMLLGDHIMLFSLLCLACDRLWAILDTASHRRRCRLAAVVLAALASWLAALALSLPAWVAVHAAFYPGRLTCSPGPGCPLGYGIVLLCLGCILPVLAAAACLVASLRLVAGSGGSGGGSGCGSGGAGSGGAAATSGVGTATSVLASASGISTADSTIGSRGSRGGNASTSVIGGNRRASFATGPLAALSGWLIAAWLLLAAPYVMLTSADRLKSAYAEEATGAIGSAARVAASTIPEALETAVLVLRLAYGPALPAIVLALRQDVRRKLAAMLNAAVRCSSVSGASNAKSVDSDPLPASVSSRTRPTALEASAANRKAGLLPPLTLAPVLFATKDGVHQQLAHSQRPVRCDVSAEDPPAAAGVQQPQQQNQQRKAVRFARLQLENFPPPQHPQQQQQQQQQQQAQEQPQQLPERRRHRRRRESRAAAAAAKAAAKSSAPAAPGSFANIAACQAPTSAHPQPKVPPNKQNQSLPRKKSASSAPDPVAAEDKRRPVSSRRLRQNSVEPPPPLVFPNLEDRSRTTAA